MKILQALLMLAAIAILGLSAWGVMIYLILRQSGLIWMDPMQFMRAVLPGIG